jgi:hypothetical protein
MADEKQFADGIIFKLPNDKAPDFVKGSILIKVEDAIKWLQSQGKDWVNLDLKVAQSGKAYAEVNTWQPKSDF